MEIKYLGLSEFEDRLDFIIKVGSKFNNRKKSKILRELSTYLENEYNLPIEKHNGGSFRLDPKDSHRSFYSIENTFYPRVKILRASFRDLQGRNRVRAMSKSEEELALFLNNYYLVYYNKT